MTREEQLFLKSLTQPVTENVAGCNIDTILKIAAKHNVLSLCYEHLYTANGFEYNNPKLIQKAFSTVASQTKRTTSFKKLYRLFLQSGIKPIVLKGIICRNLYGELSDHRPSGDEDILVKKEDFFATEKILTENGFTADKKVNYKMLSGIQEITFKSPKGLNIEVHLNIIGTENGLRRKMNSYFDTAFDDAIEIEIDGINFCTLSYTQHYIYLFYHLFKHFAMTGVGVRQILDLLKFGEYYKDKIDFDRVHAAVMAVNAQKLYGDIIEIGNRYMGFDNKNEFGASFPEKLMKDIFSAGAYGNNTSEQVGSKVKVLAAVGSGSKTSRLRMLFPPLMSMREYYTILYNHPYLLPFMWLVRIFRYVFRSKTGQTFDITKSESIADAKIQLLKDYHIIG